jgi:hypothetical protein
VGTFPNPYKYTPRTIVTSIKIDPATAWGVLNYTYNNAYVAGTRTIYRISSLPNAPDYEIEYDYVSKKWYDKGHLEPTVVNQVGGDVPLTATVSGVTLIRAKFVDPYFFHPTPVQTINFDSGTTWGDDLSTPRNYKYIYGPVPSWRLGASLGIDPVSGEAVAFDRGETPGAACVGAVSGLPGGG